jgi:ABC-2 type transport system ATP-binding protein
MTVMRQLVYFAKLKGMAKREAVTAAHEWLERMDLAEWKDRKLETLSKGMSQKIQFIATIIARPRLLILDEPFSGLDPVNLDLIRQVLLKLKREGTTLLFSTHDMHMAEQMCDHICMIYKGAKVLDGSLEQIQSVYGQDTLKLRFRNDVRLSESDLPGVSQLRNLGRFWEARYKGDTQPILRKAIELGELDHFEIVHPSLHDIFVRIADPDPKDIDKEMTDA